MVQLHLENLPRTLELRKRDGRLVLSYIDQRLLPGELVQVETSDWKQVVDAIKTLAVRGAPAIGVAGAAALALWVDNAESLEGLADAAECIASARPTAVNLRWGVERLRNTLTGCTDLSIAIEASYDGVKGMEVEDEQCNRAIGLQGAMLLPERAHVLTHCNAGSLATVFFGTALGVVYAAAEQGKIGRVYADETRPVGQGARLTAWELSRAGVPVTLICDNMAAVLMAMGSVDAVIVGADRIASNGDVANKIGTYGVAALAHDHGIPFYVAAPTSTIDMSIEDGREIIIEQRDSSEVLPESIPGVDVFNPAFDVTPEHLVTKIITERGVFAPAELRRAMSR